MDQFPTEEEMFEMQYDEEMEMLDGFDENIGTNIMEPQPGTSKSIMHQSQRSVLNSPQLSQISYDTSVGPVNRRLFGTPHVGGGVPKRMASTPFYGTSRKSTNDEPDFPNVLEEIQNVGLTKKRRLEDLFGDVQDIDFDEPTFVDREAKKLKNEEERDLDLIEKILEARRQQRETKNPMKRDEIGKLNALHAFKMRNLSYQIPNWPFLPLVRSDDERVYVRFHSEEYETKHIDDVNVFSKGYGGLLGESKAHIWDMAREITVKRLTAAENNATITPDVIEVPAEGLQVQGKLWVEKYKPRKYIDLLSDESTNRSLLFWLKMWDKVVFGKEFKTVEATKPGDLSNFNKKTGRFESSGGWKNRKSRQTLNTERDEIGRPVQKIALLCGPPGLGKTTLAHTIARHAGYQVRELNASDDRSPDAFKLALENGTQMTSVLNDNKRPNCIILDEIDGAPIQSIDFLIRFISDSVVAKGKKEKGGGKKNILKRPIICICNDMYVPSLRQLRQVAFVVNFPPIESSRLAERLLEISYKEYLKSDIGTLMALAEKSGNDVRSCISMMQFFNAQKKRLSLIDVLSSNFGQKDRHRGLFGIWSAIFQVQRPQRRLEQKDPKMAGSKDNQMITMTDMSLATRVQHVLDVVHRGGDYERLTQGVFENYLGQKMPDPDLNGIVEATQWFCFTDLVQHQINRMQNYTVYPYLQFGFVAWHLLFASLAWPKITFPSKGFEFHQKTTTTKMIFQAFKKGVTSGVVGIGQGRVILVDTIPLLKRILSPNLRSVSVQLLTPKERYDLTHTVEVMADLGLGFTQLKSADGMYQYQMEPDVDIMCSFKGYEGMTLSYFGRQLIAREVQLEKMRRATPRAVKTTTTTTPRSSMKKPQEIPTNKTSPQSIPNHLQSLQARIRKASKPAKDVVSKDFFGRITSNSTGRVVQETTTDAIVKSPIWYRYKEGFNNAVRKDVHMNELL